MHAFCGSLLFFLQMSKPALRLSLRGTASRQEDTFTFNLEGEEDSIKEYMAYIRLLIDCVGTLKIILKAEVDKFEGGIGVVWDGPA